MNAPSFLPHPLQFRRLRLAPSFPGPVFATSLLLGAVLSIPTMATSAAAQTATAPAQVPAPPAVTDTPPGATPAQPPTVATPTGQGPATPQTSAASASGSASGSAVDASSYVIGAGDDLQITVWREPTLSGVLPVRPDGMISLVLIGDIKASGRTPSQLGSDITERLKKYLQDPSVTVAVTAVNSQKIYMVGEVGHVGPIIMSPGMTPLQAISAAGGPSPYANLKRIYILRGSGATQQKIPFNYKQALKGEARPGLTLQPGDTIVVP